MKRRTPVTAKGLTQFDHLPASEAVLRAWTEPGVRPTWHRQRQGDLRDTMPVLAHALDRLARENGNRSQGRGRS